MKRTISLFLSILLALSLFSCGKEKNTQQSSDDTITAEVYISTSGSADGQEIDFGEKEMIMYLALYSDGIFHMAVEIGEENLENYPQEGKYTVSDNILRLDTGWYGTLDGDSLELCYDGEENSVSFHCTKASQ